MPILKKFPLAPAKKSGGKILALVILVGGVAFLSTWFIQKNAQPKTKLTTRIATVAPGKKLSASTRVLVMNKTDSPTTPANVIPAREIKIQTTVPPVLNRTDVSNTDPSAPRPVQNILEAQVVLARQRISPGSIDGVIGSQTRSALRAFQRSENLPATGELDAATKTKLLLEPPLYTEFIVTTNELAQLQPLGTNWWSKSQQTRLDYENVLELIAEKFCCHPGFLKQLNPTINWADVPENTVVRVPNVETSKPKSVATFIRIRLSEKNLEAFGANTNLLVHFPCSIAQRVEKRPIGELHVEKLAPNPDYTFDPENFPESAEARQLKTKLILPPGPNNPVGTVWIGLDKPGYGIHGTPRPEEIGRTESHGCFRLANWNAEYLLRLVTIGMPVVVEP